MSLDDEALEQLAKDVRYLKDRREIEDVLIRHCRGVDRHDDELLTSCYHPDAVVKHGNSPNRVSGAEYGAWSSKAHESGRFALHSHNITNVIVEIDGDVAHTEAYNVVLFLSGDMSRSTVVAGRYIDRFERRDGEWRIAVRRAFLDVPLDGAATYLGNPRGEAVDPEQFWTKKDPSYQRPIDLDTPSPQWT